METLIGTVSSVATSKFNYPDLKSRPRKTVYTERFEIHGRKIRFETTKPLKRQAINEGDEMMIAGVVQNGSFNALAMMNFTTGVASHQSFLLMFLGGLIFSSAGILILNGVGSHFLERGLIGIAMLAIFPGIFFLFGGGLLYFGYRTWRAVIAVRATPANRLHS